MSQTFRNSALPLIVALFALVLVRSVSGFFSPLPLQVDEAQYLGWSRDPAFGYYSKPPMIAWVLGLNRAACEVVGLSTLPWVEGCTRLAQSFALGIAGLFAALSSWTLFHRKQAAFAAALLLITSPLFGFLSLFATTDAWLLMFWSIALWSFICGISPGLQSSFTLAAGARADQGHWPYWVVCGAAVGLGLLSKYSMGVFVVSAFIALLALKRVFSWGPWLAAAVAFVVFLPNLIWNATQGFPTLSHHLEISQVQSLSPTQWSGLSALRSLGEFLAAQLVLIGPFALLSLLFWLPTYLRGHPAEDRAKLNLLWWFALPMLVIVVLQAGVSRAFANWAAPAYLALAILAGYLWTSSGTDAQRSSVGRRLLWLSVALGLACSALMIYGLRYAYQESAALNIRAVEKLRGWKEAALWIQNKAKARDAVVVAEDRRLLASLSGYLGLKAYALDEQNRRNHHYSWFYHFSDQRIGADQSILVVLVGQADTQNLMNRLQAAGFREITAAQAPDEPAIPVGDSGDKIQAFWATR